MTAAGRPEGTATLTVIKGTGENGHVEELDPEIERQMLERAEHAVSTAHAPETLTAKRKVAIVGFAPTSVELAPWTNESWKPENGAEIWGLNELYKMRCFTHADRWFDIHDRRDGDFSLRDGDNIKWLASQEIPIYMHSHYGDIPTSVRYPREKAIARYRTTYFTNSISYMLAVAGMEGRDESGNVIDPEKAFGEVHVYGVDMAQDSEYAHQRGSCEYFLGFLRGMGIKVYLPRESLLLKTPFMYGYEGDPRAVQAIIGARRKHLIAQRDGFQNAALQHLLNASATEGAAKAFVNCANELEKNGKIKPQDAAELRAHAQEVLFPQAQQLNAKNHELRETAAGFAGAIDDLHFFEMNLAGERVETPASTTTEPAAATVSIE